MTLKGKSMLGVYKKQLLETYFFTLKKWSTIFNQNKIV